MQAAAAQGIAHLPGAVAGEQHQWFFCRSSSNGAKLGDGYLKVGEHLQQQRLELGVCLVHLVHQQDCPTRHLQRLQQGTGLEEVPREEQLILGMNGSQGLFQRPGACGELGDLVLEQLHIEQLLAVFPFVERSGLVEPLIALQADQGLAEKLGQRLGELGLAHAGGAFHKQWLFQRCGHIDRGRHTR
jgi:hypothetical protein